jgi:hypothetical protein
MPISWPSSGLPTAFLESGYSEQRADNSISSPTDVGPGLTRRRGTAAPWFFQAQMLMTSAQWETLLTFFQTTTAYGALPFSLTQPRTNGSVTAQFVKPWPTITSYSGSPDKYIVAMSFMVHP